MQDFGPSTCFCFPTLVAPMLTRENEGSKKSVRKVVQDFVHQQYVTTPFILTYVHISQTLHVGHTQTLHVCHICLHWGGLRGQCRHICHTWSVWVRLFNKKTRCLSLTRLLGPRDLRRSFRVRLRLLREATALARQAGRGFCGTGREERGSVGTAESSGVDGDYLVFCGNGLYIR